MYHNNTLLSIYICYCFFSGLLTHNTFFDDSAYRQRRHANGKFYVSSFILSYSFTTCKLQETSNYFYFYLSTYLLKDKQGHLKKYIHTIRICHLRIESTIFLSLYFIMNVEIYGCLPMIN